MEVDQKQIERIRPLIKKWADILFLNYFEIFNTYDWSDRPKRKWAARIKVNWQYMFARIIFNMMHIKEKTDEELERIICHELLHIHMKGMAFFSDKEKTDEWMLHEERAVSHLTTAIFDLYQRSDWNDAIKASQDDAQAEVPDNGGGANGGAADSSGSYD